MLEEIYALRDGGNKVNLVIDAFNLSSLLESTTILDGPVESSTKLPTGFLHPRKPQTVFIRKV